MGASRPDAAEGGASQAVTLTTVMVSYNTRELTLSSLRALSRASDSISSEVVLIDNASTDGSAAAVRDAFPEVVVIENSENVGFARAVNQGLQVTRGSYVMLLNPDCELESHSISTLITYLRQNPGVGVVAPMVTHPDGRLKVLSAGYFPDARRLAAHYFGLTSVRLFGRTVRGVNLRAGRDSNGPRDVEWVSGACLLATRELCDLLGGLSERWFMYAEDMDFCARALDRGYRVVHLPDARVSHLVGASSDSDTAGRGAPASTIWVDNLEDFYIQRFRPRRLSLFGWRVAFAVGLMTRALAYRVLMFTRRDHVEMWRRQADNYAAYTRRSLRRRRPVA
jgi:GT2 family glycosyltransferase